MPTYDYHCTSCGHTTEARQRISDTPLTLCPECSEETLQRGPGGGSGLIFKGSGFYITDYKKKSGDQKPASSSDKE